MSLDQDEIRRQISGAREKYRPTDVRCVLVAEAPPNDPKRFFYYREVSDHDNLFLGVMQVLYPDEQRTYLASGRIPELKEQLLRRFQEDGFYLLDILDAPKKSNRDLRLAVPGFIRRLAAVAGLTTPIILIKQSVYRYAAASIKQAGFNVVGPVSIPFPLMQWREDFLSEFKKALELSGFRVG